MKILYFVLIISYLELALNANKCYFSYNKYFRSGMVISSKQDISLS